MAERKEIVERAVNTVSRMLGEGDQHAAAAIRELLAELAEETEGADNWRRLALQFDNHRMQALGHLKAILHPDSSVDEYKAAELFLKAPPLDGEEVLAQRIAELAAAATQAQEDALDAARYRFLRDTCWSSDKELATVISLQMNKVWDEKIDEAMARNKEE